PDRECLREIFVRMTLRKRYAGWKALQKLEYVDELMRSLAGKPPVQAPEYRAADYDCLNVKLKTYYARKRKLYEETYPDFYDDPQQDFRVASFITTLVMNYLFTGKFKRT